MGLGRRLAVAAVAALAAPATAFASPPTLLTVGHGQQQPTAAWTLAPGSFADAIEVATSPELRPDGRFVFENLALVDALEPSQTTYTATWPLKAGIYYVHVASCTACPLQEWSNVLMLTIPNVPPLVRAVEWSAYRMLRRGRAQLEVCDDEGAYRVEIRQQRLRRGRVVAASGNAVKAGLELTGCGAFEFEWSIPARLVATGDLYRVTLTVVDAAGARSRPLRFAARWRR